MPKKLVSFKQRFAKPILAGALLSSVLGLGPAQANPSGASVQAGNVNIRNVGPNTMHIEQLTQKAIIDWQRFGIGHGEAVRFLQPNQLSVILNRVTGGDPSHILGSLSANGNVFLINPNGILFGQSAVVNVGGLVASTLNISNEDFLSGKYRFQQDQNKALASVVNKGSITITDGGYAVLMAPLVSNEGLIVANLGKVNLMSGESATLNFDGRNLINYDVGHIDAAKPGTVVVDRETVSGLLANVITDPNLTEAGGIVENADGTVSLVGAAETVVNSGTIQANGAAGQDAGKIVLDSGRLTVVGSDAVIEASGKGEASDGGEIIALSHGTMKLEKGATIEAKGSDLGGDGGFIDTSGYGRIILGDYADASATDGERGHWLIDPEFLAIIDGADGAGQLDPPDPTNTTGLGGQSSSISVGYLEGIPAGTAVTLQADTQITINDLAGDQTIDFADGVDVTFLTGAGDILFADPNDAVRVGGDGDLTFTSGRDLYLGVARNEGTGDISLNVTRDIFDGNGAAANIVGDNLTFDARTGDVEVSANAGYGSVAGGLDVSGFSQSNPVTLNLITDNSSDITLDIVGGANGQPGVANSLTVTDRGNRVSVASSDLQTASPSTGTGVGTTVNITDSNRLEFEGLRAAVVNANTSGVMDGRGAGPHLTANTATLIGDQIGSNTVLQTVVTTLDVQGRNNNSNIRLTTTGTTDLTVRSRNSRVRIDGNDVTLANSSLETALEGIDPNFDRPAGVTDSFSTFDFSNAAVNLTFIESENRTFELNGVTANSFNLQTGGSILDSLKAIGGAADPIQADTISLSAGGRIGTFTYNKDGVTPATAIEPITVNNTAGTNGAVALTINAGGPVNIVHNQDPATNFVQFDSDDVGSPPVEDDLLNVQDSAGDSFSALNFTRSDAGDIVVGQLGSVANPLSTATLSTTNGNILNSTVLVGAGATNIFSQTLNMVALGGSVGTALDPIEVDVTEITGRGDNGFFVTNAGELEVFGLTTDGGSDSLISAANGSLRFEAAGNRLTTTTGAGVADPITDTDGEQNADNYDVAINVTLTTGDLNVDGISIDGNGGVNDATDGRALVNLVTQNGSIVSDGGTDITVGADTDVRLTASGNVGTRANQLGITSTANNPGELTIDANTNVGVAMGAGDFDVISVTHNDADVLVDGFGGEIDTASPGLDIIGTANVSTINYTNRTGNITLSDGDGIISNGTDINVTAQAGNITATANDGGDDVVANNGRVTLNATGNLAVEASSSGTGSVELGTIGGNATIRNNAGSSLDLNTAGNGTVTGTLDVDNNAGGANDLTIGQLTVGGAATFTNSGIVTQDDAGGAFDADLIASSLTVNTDAAGTTFNLDTDVNTITIDDDAAGAGIADVDIINLDALGSVTVNSRNTDIDIETDNNSGDVVYDGTNLSTGTDGMDVGTFTLTEAGGNVNINTTTLNNPRMTDVNVTTTAGNITNGGVLTTEGNATFTSSGSVDVQTDVSKTLTIAAQGTIDFVDTRTDGPDDIVITAELGQTVDGEWDAGASEIDYISGTDVLTLTDTGGADTNVSFTTNVDDIIVDAASVDKDNNLLLVSSTGSILDDGSAGVDITAQNATLLASGSIGTAADPLEICVPDVFTGRSDNGGVFVSSGDTIEHVIIDVDSEDFVLTFDEYDGAGGDSNISTTVTYDGDGTGDLSVVGGARGNSMSGTDLTVIERDTAATINVATNIDNTGDGDNDGNGEFVRLISGGSITNTTGSTISTDNADLITETGNMGTAALPILMSVEDICVSANGLDAEGFIQNDRAIRNLFLSVNQGNATGGGDVSVLWDQDQVTVGFQAGGVRVANNRLDSVSDFAGTAGTVDEAQVYVVNGSFELDGNFGMDPNANNDSFARQSNTLAGGSGGNVEIGTYTAVSGGPDPFNLAPLLEVQARGNDGGIFMAAGGAGIDLTNGGTNTEQGTVTLVAEGTNIGTSTTSIEIISQAGANRTLVNAYTENDGTTAGEGDIFVNSTNDIEFRQVISGTDLSFVAPFHDNGGAGFVPGGVTPPALATPGTAPPEPPREGDVVLTSTGEICATDIRAGAGSDVSITSTGVGDILIGTVAARSGSVTVENQNGAIDEKNDDTNGNVFANEFIGITRTV